MDGQEEIDINGPDDGFDQEKFSEAMAQDLWGCGYKEIRN
jgi:hypothetical protein